jgi:hypothetical protein
MKNGAQGNKRRVTFASLRHCGKGYARSYNMQSTCPATIGLQLTETINGQLYSGLYPLPTIGCLPAFND